MRIWKCSWSPGDFELRDGRQVSYTADDVRQGVERLRGLVRSGWGIPLIEAHDEALVPVAAAQLAADVRTRRGGTIGQVLDARVRPDGVAEFLLDLPDAHKDYLRRKPYVSPQLHTDWQTGGRVLPGLTPTHLALARVPIWRPDQGQRPFQLSADPGRRPRVVQLGEAKPLGNRPMTTQELDELLPLLKRNGVDLPADQIKDFDSLKLGLNILAGAEEGEGTELSPPVLMSADGSPLSGHNQRLRAEARERAKRYSVATPEERQAEADADAYAKRLNGNRRARETS